MSESDVDSRAPQADSPALTRRSLLAALGSATAAATAASCDIQEALFAKGADAAAAAKPKAPPTIHDRLVQTSEQLRIDRARENAQQPVPPHPNNGDEKRYANKIGSDTRGLPHNDLGEVDLEAWNGLSHALETQEPADFERIKLGGTRKLQQPLGTLAINLVGLSSPQLVIPPAPELAGNERAADAIEVYWQSLLRDVPFHEYRNDTKNPLILAAVAELTQVAGYTGPRDASRYVTPELLFRGTARYRHPNDPERYRSVVPTGVGVGPYISQFILKDVPYGAQTIPGLLKVQAPGKANDFLTQYEEWLAIQNGTPATKALKYDSKPRRLITGRDLAEYAHHGSPAFWAASLLLGTPVEQGGIGAPLHPNNPYLKSVKTSSAGVATWGLPFIQSLLPLSASIEIRANYWQKWHVHRTLRPEAYGGLVHNRLTKKAEYPVHQDILHSEALDRSFKRYGTYLLSSAYPEGAPLHSSYPGGASASASVNATILKAFFDENYVIPNPVQPDPKDLTKLIPYTGEPLTVGGELNKLAANVGQGRNWAGIHFRSDAAASLPHAEEVAIAILRDQRNTFLEPFDGFSFTRFDGSNVTI